MEIQATESGSFRIIATKREFGALHQCLNEVCNALKIPEFEKWIGAVRSEVSAILSVMLSARRRAPPVEVFAPGLRIAVPVDGEFCIEVTRDLLWILRNCVYETCNRIHLFEFQTRVGIELEAALGMLRLMTEQFPERRRRY